MKSQPNVLHLTSSTLGVLRYELEISHIFFSFASPIFYSLNGSQKDDTN